MTKGRFLDPAEISAALSEVAAAAAACGEEVALIGGVAMEFYGSDRLTRDVDLIASGPIVGLSIVRRLSFGGSACLSSRGHPIDLVVREDEYRNLYDEALARSVRADDLPVPIASAEHLAAMKMAAGRDKDELDLKTLIRIEAIDVEKTESIIWRHLGLYAVKEFASTRDLVAWEKERARKGES